MEFGSFDSEEDGEYNCIEFVVLPNTQGTKSMKTNHFLQNLIVDWVEFNIP